MPVTNPATIITSNSTRNTGDLTEHLIATDVWSDEMLAAAGIPVVDAPIVSVGGGMGSFVMATYLRIAGLATDQIRVLSNIHQPWETYEYLTRVSQVPRPERLRSDSQGMPDCLWGFPSYAAREARRDRSLFPIWNVLTEPVFADYWTPRAGTVFEGLRREAQRIRYDDMVVNGTVRMVRRRHGGGYFTVLTPPDGQAGVDGTPRRIAYRSTHVHLAIGYPGLRFLPDLQEYRTTHGDYARVVNAYEPHEQIYEGLLKRPSRVLVRGGGIVASRVLQRLMEDRINLGAQTEILHLFRTYYSGRHNQWGRSKRRGAHGFAFQGFNAPKSAWGGQHRQQLERLEGADRKALYDLTGGAHTPYRKLWLDEMRLSREQGWYHTFQGEVTDVRPAGSRIATTIEQDTGSTTCIETDVIIDCTGLEADIREHRIFGDLLDHGGLGRNPLGRVDVDLTFEARGTRSGPGRLYVTGSAAYGGYFAGVDTFLGLQFAAQRVADDLASIGFGRRIGISRSVANWWKWMRHQPL
jgi:hypothetical protein